MLTGAKPSLQGTPGTHVQTLLTLTSFSSLGMIGYGLAKAAVHQLVQSLYVCTRSSL